MSNLTRLTLRNNSLTVMDRDLFQVGTLNYTAPYFVKPSTLLTKYRINGIIPTTSHIGHSNIPC